MSYYPKTSVIGSALLLDPNLPTRILSAMMRSILSSVLAILAVTILAGGCGGGRLGFGDKTEDAAPKTVDLARPNTPSARAVQVAWTAARAQYCAFGMNREKLRSDYLAYETAQGATPEQAQGIARHYDTTFEAFYARIRGIPNYCTRARIEGIRPDINRHLRGDYTPSPRRPAPAEQDFALPRAPEGAFDRYDKDPAGHEDN